MRSRYWERRITNSLYSEFIDRYQSHHVADLFWDALLDDLIRYHRSLRIIYRWTRRDEPAGWRARDLKMSHSRLLIYAGLLFLLGEASRQDPSGSRWLAGQLHLTPLERLAVSPRDPDELQRVIEILRCYDRFLEMLGHEQFPQLIARSDEDDERLQANRLYRELRGNGETLSNELYALLQARSSCWTAEFRKEDHSGLLADRAQVGGARRPEAPPHPAFGHFLPR